MTTKVQLLAFDLLELDGEDLRRLPVEERKVRPNCLRRPRRCKRIDKCHFACVPYWIKWADVFLRSQGNHGGCRGTLNPKRRRAEHSLVSGSSALASPPAAAAALLAQPDKLVLIAEIDSLPVGYAYAEIVHRPETTFSYTDDLIYLHHISVRPTYRKQGVGTALMDAVRVAAGAKGIGAFAVDIAARTFFLHQGFTPYNERLWSR
jgi:GNAT superfamily N-acetyltransferase